MIMTEKIIIAEDDAILREVLELLVGARYDARIDTVPDGRSLVEKVRNDRYSVVLTDNRMLAMSGLQAIREIREFDQEVPIIMLSGFDVKEEALETGATHYLDKSKVSGATLYPILDEYLAEHT